MEVLKQPEEAKPIEVTCNRCKALLSIVTSDVTYVSAQRDGDYVYTTCAVCSNSITITVSELPESWRWRTSFFKRNASSYYDI